MGEVWRARDTRLGRDVALKVLPDDLAGSAERRLPADEGLQIQHHSTRIAISQASETEAVVESCRGFVDGVGDEQAKRHRPTSRKLDRESQRFLEQELGQPVA